jgi:hypothetical protein
MLPVLGTVTPGVMSTSDCRFFKWGLKRIWGNCNVSRAGPVVGEVSGEGWVRIGWARPRRKPHIVSRFIPSAGPGLRATPQGEERQRCNGDTACSVTDTYPARTARERARTVRQRLVRLACSDDTADGQSDPSRTTQGVAIWRGTGSSNPSPSTSESGAGEAAYMPSHPLLTDRTAIRFSRVS